MSMSAECCGARAAVQGRSVRKRLALVGLASTPAALLAVLLPKCPLCLGAQLALLGVGVALPSSGYAMIVSGCVALSAGVLILARRARI